MIPPTFSYISWYTGVGIGVGAVAGVYAAVLLIAARRPMRIARKTIPGFKSLLMRLHKDLFAIERMVLPWDGEPKVTIFEKLVLVLEDRRFFRHFGFDLIAFTRECLKAACGRKHGGASTIDMQFVRTVTGFKERSIKRKLYEILLAWIIQYRYSKLLILRSYLECAFFGSHLYGADRSSVKINGKTVALLSDDEAALLAAMLVYPRPVRPVKEWRSKVERRAAYGLRRMRRFKKSLDKIPTGK